MKTKHRTAHLFFKYIKGRALEQGPFCRSDVLAQVMADLNLIQLYVEDEEGALKPCGQAALSSWYEYRGQEPTQQALELMLQGREPTKGGFLKRFKMFFTGTLLIVSLNTFGQYGAAVNTLQAGGWFNSHHEAYKFGPQRQINDYNYQAVEVYKDLAVEQIRANPQQRINVQQVQQCFTDEAGFVYCQ